MEVTLKGQGGFFSEGIVTGSRATAQRLMEASGDNAYGTNASFVITNDHCSRSPCRCVK
jgi:hypothetical protein